MANEWNVLYICAIGDNTVDLQDILTALGEADIADTIALQEAIMQSQNLAATTTAAGISDFYLINCLLYTSPSPRD